MTVIVDKTINELSRPIIVAVGVQGYNEIKAYRKKRARGRSLRGAVLFVAALLIGALVAFVFAGCGGVA